MHRELRFAQAAPAGREIWAFDWGVLQGQCIHHEKQTYLLSSVGCEDDF